MGLRGEHRRDRGRPGGRGPESDESLTRANHESRITNPPSPLGMGYGGQVTERWSAMKNALVMYAASETDANLFYATKFLVGDPIAYIQVGRRKMIVLNDLEIGRGRDQAEVDEVLSLSEITRRVGKQCTMA